MYVYVYGYAVLARLVLTDERTYLSFKLTNGKRGLWAQMAAALLSSIQQPFFVLAVPLLLSYIFLQASDDIRSARPGLRVPSASSLLLGPRRVQ